MKIRVFQSDKGDCLLLTSQSGTHRVLVDGGMASSFTAHVAPTLAKLAQAKKPLDAVYLSHIDEDHITGVLKLMDDLLDWRVFDFQKKARNPNIKKPTSLRPPEVSQIWHNAFHELLKDNAGEIQDMLAASTSILAVSRTGIAVAAFDEQSQLAQSQHQGMELARRVGTDQLNIPVNPQYQNKLMLIKNNAPKLTVGPIEFRLIGPFPRDLKKLRSEWNTWLRDNKEKVKEIQREAKADEDRLKSDVERLLAPLTLQADAFAAFRAELAKKLGLRSEVTTPNLASLMLLAQEGNQTVLLTGDGHADDAIAGLKHHQLLDANDALHVDVLKVQHHGSEHNMTPEFAEQITADDYIFCGNGFSTNPELDVVDIIVKKRQKAFPQKAFTFWFNSTEALTKPSLKKHMKALRNRVDEHVASGGGKVKAKWISGSFMDL